MILDEKKFIEGHIVSPMEKKIWYPILIDRAEGKPIVRAIMQEYGTTALAGAIIGFFAGGVVGSVVSAVGIPLLEKGISGFSDYTRDIFNPLKKSFNFNVRDFVSLIGFKKDLNLQTDKKDLVTVDFKVLEGKGPEPDPHDNDAFRRISYLLSGGFWERNKEENLISRYEYADNGDEYIEKLLKNDVFSVGGPIPIDPLFDKMRKRAFPCNYELKNPELFPDKIHKKYEIKVSDDYLKGHQNEFKPEWNKFNFGLITIVTKTAIFDEGSGIFVNVSGCNWQGTEGAASYFYKEPKLNELLNYIGNDKGKNIQIVVKTPLKEIGGEPIVNKTELIDKFIF